MSSHAPKLEPMTSRLIDDLPSQAHTPQMPEAVKGGMQFEDLLIESVVKPVKRNG